MKAKFTGILVVVSMLAASGVFAEDCSESAGMSAAEQGVGVWSSWCNNCGGTVVAGSPSPRCVPGANWCGSSSGSTGNGVFYQFGSQVGGAIRKALFGDPEQIERAAQESRQMIQDLNQTSSEQMRLGDAMLQNAAAQARLLDNQQRQEALSNLQGIPPTDGELILKPSTDFFGAPGNPKDTFSSPVDSSVVDLRFLDPNKMITLDPNIVKGKERAFPVQPDLGTSKNANHNKGLEALLNNKPELAVRYFEEARKERPNDPLIRNDLLLAQDLVKVRQQKEQEKKIQTDKWIRYTYEALMSGRIGEAWATIIAAEDLNPVDEGVHNLGVLVRVLVWEINQSDTPEKRDSYKMAGQGIAFFAQGNFSAAMGHLKSAQAENPDDPVIKELIRQMHQAEEKLRSGAAEK